MKVQIQMKRKLSPVSHTAAVLILGAAYAAACYQYVTSTCVTSGSPVGVVAINGRDSTIMANGNWNNDSYATGSGYNNTKSQACSGAGYYSNPYDLANETISFLKSDGSTYSHSQDTVDTSSGSCP
jgi:hypothetical protein